MVDTPKRAAASAGGASAGAEGGATSNGGGSTQEGTVRNSGRGSAGGSEHRVTAREVARQVYGESGLRGFYRGFGISVLQFAPTSAVSYFVFCLVESPWLVVCCSERVLAVTTNKRVL